MRPGIGFFAHIAVAEGAVINGQPAPDHFATNIQSGRGPANRHHSTVGVYILLFAGHDLVLRQGLQHAPGFGATAKAPAGLIAFERVDPEQANMPAIDHHRIAIDHKGLSRDTKRPCRRRYTNHQTDGNTK